MEEVQAEAEQVEPGQVVEVNLVEVVWVALERSLEPAGSLISLTAQAATDKTVAMPLTEPVVEVVAQAVAAQVALAPMEQVGRVPVQAGEGVVQLVLPLSARLASLEMLM